MSCRWRLPILLLGLWSCKPPERIIPDGAVSGAVLLLVEFGGGGPVRVSRFEPAFGGTWSRSNDDRQLEVWVYDCGEDLPRRGDGWLEGPLCLPEPLRRHHYEFERGEWSLLLEGTPSPVPFCDPCRRPRLNVQTFQLAQTLARPELGAGLWVGPGRGLFAVQERGPEGPAADAWFWSERGEPVPRPLTLAGPTPRIGAMTRLADGRILAAGDQLWLVQLEPNEQAPERVVLSPWPTPHATLPGMTERLSVALEAEDGDLLLGSSVGSLSWLHDGALLPLIERRTHPRPYHPVSMGWIGEPEHRLLLEIGLGKDVEVLEDASLEMNDYRVIDLVPTQTATVVVSQFRLFDNPRASTVVEEGARRRGYVVDRQGQLWRVEDNGTPEMLLEGGLKGGPLTAHGDSLLLMGARGGVQLYSLRVRQRCDTEQVGRTALISSGPDETFALDYAADSGAWLSPRLCPAEAED